MRQYLVLKGGSKTFKFSFEGNWGFTVDQTGADGDGTVTLQLDFPNEEFIKEMDVIMSYAFKVDKC